MNGAFYHRETWLIYGTVNDHNGQPLPLAGATVTFRLDGPNNSWSVVKQASFSGPVGKWELRIAPDEQDDVTPGTFPYEVRAVFPDGVTSIQNAGLLKILPSRFAL